MGAFWFYLEYNDARLAEWVQIARCGGNMGDALATVGEKEQRSDTYWHQKEWSLLMVACQLSSEGAIEIRRYGKDGSLQSVSRRNANPTACRYLKFGSWNHRTNRPRSWYEANQLSQPGFKHYEYWKELDFIWEALYPVAERADVQLEYQGWHRRTQALIFHFPGDGVFEDQTFKYFVLPKPQSPAQREVIIGKVTQMIHSLNAAKKE